MVSRGFQGTPSATTFFPPHEGEPMTLRTRILSELSLGQTTVYRLAARTGVGFLTIHTELLRLEASGLVDSEWMDESYPRRRVYALKVTHG